jgi:hypothetical protein
MKPLREIEEEYSRLSKSQIVERLSQIFLINDPIQTLEEMNPTQEEEEKLLDLTDGGIITSYYQDILRDLFEEEENPIMFSKFLKTRKRFSTVVELTWEKLSIPYKTYLLYECGRTSESRVELFRVSETCEVYLDCSIFPSKLKKNTSECITQQEKNEYFNSEDFIRKRILS